MDIMSKDRSSSPRDRDRVRVETSSSNPVNYWYRVRNTMGKENFEIA